MKHIEYLKTIEELKMQVVTDYLEHITSEEYGNMPTIELGSPEFEVFQNNGIIINSLNGTFYTMGAHIYRVAKEKQGWYDPAQAKFMDSFEKEKQAQFKRDCQSGNVIHKNKIK